MSWGFCASKLRLPGSGFDYDQAGMLELASQLTAASPSSVARAYHDNQVSCLAHTEVLAEINIDVFMTKVPGAVW